MLKYATLLILFAAGVAFAQAPNPGTGATPGAGQPGVNQPVQGQTNPTPSQTAAPNQTGATTPGQPINSSGANARNAAIQQIEQALQLLRQNNQ